MLGSAGAAKSNAIVADLDPTGSKFLRMFKKKEYEAIPSFGVTEQFHELIRPNVPFHILLSAEDSCLEETDRAVICTTERRFTDAIATHVMQPLRNFGDKRGEAI